MNKKDAKMGCIYTVMHYPVSSIKKSEIVKFPGKWTDLKTVISSERS